MCIYINRLLGKPDFMQIKSLAFPISHKALFAALERGVGRLSLAAPSWVIYAIVLLVFLLPHAGPLKGPVVLYGELSRAMAWRGLER